MDSEAFQGQTFTKKITKNRLSLLWLIHSLYALDFPYNLRL